MSGSNTKLIDIGRTELRKARKQSRGLFWFVGLFSFFANLLMLTGPLYMMQVYDRVLGSGSLETLTALSILVLFLYAMMGLLEYSRGRVLGRIGARFQSSLDKRVFDASLRKAAFPDVEGPVAGPGDLVSISRLFSSPVFGAIFDLPWTPIFLLGIWMFHPWLGVLALSGGAFLVVVTLANQMTTRRPAAEGEQASAHAQNISDQVINEPEVVQALGMRGAVYNRWHKARDKALNAQIRAADLGGTFTTTTKTFRLLLQSAMLGLAALLVLRGQMTPGAMIAGSILMGRALAPVEQLIGQWPMVQAATQGWGKLAELLGTVPAETERTELPVPEAKLEVSNLAIAPPGEKQLILKAVSFNIEPGQAVGVIGTSGSGKSTLARALTGTWAPTAGQIRLGGAMLNQYAPDVLGQHIGYLPQKVQLFDGTIAENISRLVENSDPKLIVEAARRADAHDMILKLPNGYDTRVTANGSRLSGGQTQRVGLARAMYGDPVFLVLDEPNSNLDNEGSEAVNRAIRNFKNEGKSLIIIAHRPAAILECDMLLTLEGGTVRAFGPRENVLQQVLKTRSDPTKARAVGGVK
ncbi:type I secretion system ATPase [Rhodobacteraceae bacterium KLH11]|nr:type I secretion system ATPase [Rhodobacteraceae bacterium KLH11]